MGKFFLAIILFIGFSGNSFAGFIISVDSNVPLLLNTDNQAVDVFLMSNLDSDPAIKGMNLNVYIGNSADDVLKGGQGVFSGTRGSLEGVILLGPTYFWNEGSGSTIAGKGRVSGAPAVIQAGVFFNGEESHKMPVNMPVKIATLIIDTTGVTPGTYALSLNDPFRLDDRDNFLPTDLIDTLGAPINNVSFTNGSYTITAVPEPSTFFLVALGTGIVAMRRRIASRWNSQLAA